MFKNIFLKYFSLTKPKITFLVIFCTVISMFLAINKHFYLKKIIFSTIGIWLISSSAFIINCLIEKKRDILMKRTQNRATAKNKINIYIILLIFSIFNLSGIYFLYTFVNKLTMWLTIITFIGYSIIYTIFIKPFTSYNIIIGGLPGALPPILGWATIKNTIFSIKPWILVLIIFFWTPPHFWSLAMFYKKDYIKSKLPILPITHGEKFTKINIFIYTIIVFIISLIPFFIKMSGYIYIYITILLNLIFIKYSWNLFYKYTNYITLKTFKYSIYYLFLMFITLLIDHYYFF
ncbi:heme o synthase [Candidatus Zinderia endosymbiont of Aphrophora alni]|uniref:heme o synthase n=1 Tax=Candidatus Zinderia endosymbiont of Aphrophora alni TaxID=3077951 RepID=UPI0030CC6BBF